MIWDQDVRVIVMLTAESEGGQLKCHPYWKGREFGPIKLRPLSEKKVSLDIDKSRSNPLATPAPPSSDSASNVSQAELGRRRANTTTSTESNSPFPAQSSLGSQSSNSAGETPYVIVRKFALSHASHPFSPIREITQLHYPSWPDFGTPAQPSHLLALVELANVMQRAAALPVGVPSTIAASVTENDAQPATGGGQPVRKAAETAPFSWPDSPENSESVRPMLVHCSAGCGRTGAFCTVDSVIDMLKRQRLAQPKRPDTPQSAEKRKRDGGSREERATDAEGDVDMEASTASAADASKYPSALARPTLTPPKASAAGGSGGELNLDWLDDAAVDLVASTVEDFRRQRLSMVQSLRQFVLCYETVIEYLWRLQQRDSCAGGPGALTRARSGSLNR